MRFTRVFQRTVVLDLSFNNQVGMATNGASGISSVYLYLFALEVECINVARTLYGVVRLVRFFFFLDLARPQNVYLRRACSYLYSIIFARSL